MSQVPPPGKGRGRGGRGRGFKPKEGGEAPKPGFGSQQEQGAQPRLPGARPPPRPTVLQPGAPQQPGPAFKQQQPLQEYPGNTRYGPPKAPFVNQDASLRQEPQQSAWSTWAQPSTNRNQGPVAQGHTDFKRPRPLRESSTTSQYQNSIGQEPHPSRSGLVPLTRAPATHGAAGRAAVRGNSRGESRPVGQQEQLTQAVAGLSLGGGDAMMRRRNPYEPPVPLPVSAENKVLHSTETHQKVELLTNYFALSKRTDQLVTQYRVDFEPNFEDKRFKSRLIRNLQDKLAKHYLFDGNNDLKMLKSLPDELTTFKVETDKGPVNIEIKKVAVLAPNHPELCHLYNSQIRRNLSHLGYIQIGRNYFQPLRKHELKDFKVEIWPGLITPIGEHERGILMAVQTNNKFLRSDRVIDVMREIEETNPPSTDRNKLGELYKNVLLGSVVMTKYNNRTYTIVDFDLSQTPRSTFELKSGATTSYIDYYQKHHDVRIQDPRQPLIVAQSKEKEVKSTSVEKKNVNLIPELCCLTGLSEKQRTNFFFMQNVARFTRLSPSQRVQELAVFMQEMARHAQVAEEMKAWNLQFEPTPLKVLGHRLESEEIIVGSNKRFTPNSETLDFTPVCRNQLYDPRGLPECVVIVPEFLHRNNSSKLTLFFNDMKFVSNSMGFRLDNFHIHEIKDDRVGSYHTAFHQVNPNAEMVLVITPTNRADKYQAIKKQSIQEKGIPSQVICLNTITRAKNMKSLCTKVALQMSCKIGGVPWHLSIPFKTLMVLGYDTYHDSSAKGKSLGALVSSIDMNITRWYSQGRRHQTLGAQEISNTMEAMFTLALKKYYSVNNRFPETIFYYRDGVGEGQIANVKLDECEKIIEAYRNLTGKDMLKLVFVVVNKRINTRYFAAKNNQVSNPLPGTVVDTDITKKNRIDFFLVSQSVRQGTVSPTSYYVIEDTTTIPINRIQRMTYKLTHLYFNWTGTISVPAPCQYAHKLAFLMGQALNSERIHVRLQDKLFFL